MALRNVILQVKTNFDSYEVVEEVYTGRLAKMLYSGPFKTAQSGIPLDGKDTMLFEYNQRFIELIKQLGPRSLLVIGGGAYSLPAYINSHYPSIKITVAEPDPKLKEIAKRHFNLDPSKMSIFDSGGLDFLKKYQDKYDLIIIDAYSDQQLPKELMVKEFVNLVINHLNPQGLLAANIISDLKADSVVSKFHEVYKNFFKYFKVFPASTERSMFYPSNFIYVAANQPIKFSLRYQAISWQ